LVAMANETVGQTAKANGGFGALWRFLPMLWPKGQTELKARVAVAVILVLAGKAAVLVMPFAYKAVIDGMSSRTAAFGMVAGLVVVRQSRMLTQENLTFAMRAGIEAPGMIPPHGGDRP